MIIASMTVNYVSPSGRVFNDAPDCKEMQTGWEKVWHLHVEGCDIRYFSEHKERLSNGRAEDPNFNEHIKSALVENICGLIGNVIAEQI